jgi:hypothetical protein
MLGLGRNSGATPFRLPRPHKSGIRWLTGAALGTDAGIAWGICVGSADLGYLEPGVH